MEELKVKNFQCDIHKDELIRKICSNLECPKPLCCIDCILDEQKVHQAHKKSFLSISDFIDYVAEEYKTLKKIRLGTVAPPSNLTEFLASEDEALQRLTQHVEKEKLGISQAIDTLIENFTIVCKQEKERVFKTLDEQIVILKANFEHYKNKMQQYYGPANESNPSKSELIQKINQSNSAKEFKKMISKIQSEILSRAPEDKKVLDAKINELKFQFLEMAKMLRSSLNLTPSVKLISGEDGNPKIDQILSENLTSVLKEELKLDNTIDQFEMNKIQPLSKIMTVEELNQIMTWISNKTEISLKPLYRGSKDGFGAKIFHEKVGTLKPTVVLIQSNHGKRFGGYTDLDWTGNNGWKNSSASFLFSLNEKEKYMVKAPSHAININDSTGPAFGSDLTISDQANTKSNTCNFGKVYDSKGKNNSQFAGAANFTVQEIEIFQVV